MVSGIVDSVRGKSISGFDFLKKSAVPLNTDTFMIRFTSMASSFLAGFRQHK